MSRMRSIGLAVALFSAIAALGACQRTARQAPEPGPIVLHVRNNAFLDVVVYALPSVGLEARVRLATVTGHSDVRLDVRESALRPGGILVVYMHAIGSRYDWTSPAVMVDTERPACLDIFASPDGSLSRSSLYVLPGPIALGHGDSAGGGIQAAMAHDSTHETVVCGA